MITSDNPSEPDGENPEEARQTQVNGEPDRQSRQTGESAYRFYRRRVTEKLRRITHEEHLAYGTWTLAVGTWGLFVLAYCALKDNQEIALQGQRAWIAPIGAVQLPEGLLKTGTSPFRFDIQYRNTGREPALNVNTDIGNGETVALPPNWRNGEWADFKAGENKACRGASPLNGGPVVYPSNLFDSLTIHRTLNDVDRITQIATPLVAFVYKGCIVYESGNRRHESGYCFYLQPSVGVPSDRWTFRICSEGNHAD
jgi:hypothetical protein